MKREGDYPIGAESLSRYLSIRACEMLKWTFDIERRETERRECSLSYSGEQKKKMVKNSLSLNLALHASEKQDTRT